MSKKSDHAKHTANTASRPAVSEKTLELIKVVKLVVASVIFTVSLIVKMPNLVGTILLILSAVVAGYDIFLEAASCIEDRDYFATPIIIIFVCVISIVIGFKTEGAALILLYQIGQMLVAYVAERTKKSALDLLIYQDEDTRNQVSEIIKTENVGATQIELTMKRSSGLVLKAAMVFALVYAIALPLMTSFTYSVSIHRALMIILITTPMSIVVAAPIAAIVGICYSAQQGIVYKSAAAMENASLANIAVFDKDGIFSSESPRVTSVESDVLDSSTFMNFAAHAAYYSDQPIAKAISAVYNQDYRLDVISDFAELPGYGVELKIGGSPVTLATRELFVSRGISLPDDNEAAGKAYYMTVSDRYVGRVVTVSDVNDDAIELVSGMAAAGVKRCILLTGDSDSESHRFAEELDFTEVYSQCDTERKLQHINDLSDGNNNCVMYIYANGIESHSAATVDMRVSRKTKYADAIALPDHTANIPFSLQVCNRVREIIIENAVFAFVVKAILIFLSIIGYCNIWFAIFIDMVAAIATNLNAIRVVKESMFKSGRNRGS